MEITYESIEPLIVESYMQGSKMVVQFQAPDADKVIESSASIKRERNVQSEVRRVVSRQASNQLRRTVGRMVRSVLGGGMLGRIGYQTVNAATRETTRNITKGYSKSDKQRAIVEAFQKVAEEFEYNERSGTWRMAGIVPNVTPQFTSKSKRTTTSRTTNSSNRNKSRSKKEEVPTNVSPFEAQLYKGQIRSSFDKEVLSRMLIELANADGGVTVEEEELLKSFIPDYQEYRLSEPLSPIECEEVSEEVKPTLYMLAWTVSLIDMDLDPMEAAKLEEFGEWYELSDDQKASLQKIAKSYILEQSVNPDSAKSEVYQVAEKLGIGQDEALRMFIQYKKRQG